jgi:periplasmic divalent cation tolerance protein
MAGEIIVLITASSANEAEKIGTALVDEHLAACVNMVPEIRSLFFWEGKTRDEHETLLICKSRQQLLDKLIQRVKELHSYTVPEILALPIIGGSSDYIAWMLEATRG